jgi:hypothetical protein
MPDSSSPEGFSGTGLLAPVNAKLAASIEMERHDVLRSKIKPEAPPVSAAANVQKDPARQASLIATFWRQGVDSVIECGVLMMESVRAFRADPERLDSFVTALVEVGLLTSREARLGLRSPKLVKLSAIGEHADLLRHADIAAYLGPTYSTIYQLIVLFRQMEGEHEQKLKRLVGLLSNCPTEVTRDYLSDETERLKRSRKSKQAKPSPESAELAHRADTESTARANTTYTLSGLVDARLEVDLAVLTPTEQDLRALGRDYADGSALERCFPLVQVLQHNDDLALVVSARESDFPLVAERLLNLCGFRRVNKVLLVRKQNSWDITEAEILVVAERGAMRLTPSTDCGWSDEAGEIDPLAIAARLYPDAKRKLHVFASVQTEGWTALVGADSWADEPSMR